MINAIIKSYKMQFVVFCSAWDLLSLSHPFSWFVEKTVLQKTGLWCRNRDGTPGLKEHWKTQVNPTQTSLKCIKTHKTKLTETH